MKLGNRDWLKQQQAMIDRLVEEGVIRDLPLRTKYLLDAAFKFGGKKRTGSNSGNVGRRARRRERHGGR